MILNTGQRTDIPAFFSEWLANRIKEGYVLVRNPYNPSLVSRYEINPQVVDAIGFCTKNPAPFFPYLELIKDFGQFWYVTITPYGKDIEPGVPDKSEVIESFKKASGVDIPYVIAPRRPGDIDECYADASLAKAELGWEAKYNIEDMCADTWRWQSANPNGYKN